MIQSEKGWFSALPKDLSVWTNHKMFHFSVIMHAVIISLPKWYKHIFSPITRDKSFFFEIYVDDSTVQKDFKDILPSVPRRRSSSAENMSDVTRFPAEALGFDEQTLRGKTCIVTVWILQFFKYLLTCILIVQ